MNKSIRTKKFGAFTFEERGHDFYGKSTYIFLCGDIVSVQHGQNRFDDLTSNPRASIEEVLINVRSDLVNLGKKIDALEDEFIVLGDSCEAISRELDKQMKTARVQ